MPAKDHAGTQGPEKRPGTQGCLRQEASQVHRQRSTVLRIFHAVASVTLHVIKAKAKKKLFFQYAKNGTDTRSLSVPIFASRLLVSEANVSTVLFLDGLISERVHDLERSTANHVLE